MARKWIQSAIKHPGSFSREAEKAGKSTAEYAREEKDAPGKLGRRARLALTLRKLSSRRQAQEFPQMTIGRPEEHIDKPRYRISFETSADSPEELDRKVAKGMHRHLKRKGGRKMRRR